MFFYLSFLLKDKGPRFLISDYKEKIADTFYTLNGIDVTGWERKFSHKGRMHGLLFFIPLNLCVVLYPH